MLALNNYHLLLIGATVPLPDRQAIVLESRSLGPERKIVSVERPGTVSQVGADQVVAAGDEAQLLAAVAFIARERV